MSLTLKEAETGHELLSLMGNVLATWQGVEHVVTDIYLIFFKPSRVDPAAVAYHAVRTFDMRLGVVAALIKFYCSDEQNQEWRGLLREIRKRMTSRNAVAHGLVYRHGAIGDGEFVIGETIYNISDFPDDTTSKNGFYTRKELKEICIAFASLTPKLNDFRQRLENDTRLQAALNAPISKVSQQESRIRLNAYAAPPIDST